MINNAITGLGFGSISSLLYVFDMYLNTSVDLLTKDIFAGGNDAFGTIFTLVKEVKEVVTPISLEILALLFLIEFLKMTIKYDVLKFEHFIKIFFKFSIAKGAMDISETFLDLIYSISCKWIKGIGDIGEQFSFVEYAKSGLETLEDYNIIEQISFNMTSGYLFPIILLSGIIMMVIAYARIFEIMCYIAISPLPCAFIVQENCRITLKFFLSYTAVCLQGVFMVLSIQIVRCLAQNIFTTEYQNVETTLVYIYNMVIISVLSLFVMAKSNQWASKVLDAM